MDIKSSLNIEDNNRGKINLILSGTFVRVYNQSFYLLSQILGRRLKPDAKFFKSAGNRFVVCGGFPWSQVIKDYPQAKKTAWGYQIDGNYDLAGYEQWLMPHKQAAKAVVNAASAVAPSCTQRVQGGSTGRSTNFVQDTGDLDLTLNPQLAQYLSNWQRGLNPIESDLDFIESIQQLISH